LRVNTTNKNKHNIITVDFGELIQKCSTTSFRGVTVFQHINTPYSCHNKHRESSIQINKLPILFYILDPKWNDECIGFTVMWVFIFKFLCLSSPFETIKIFQHLVWWESESSWCIREVKFQNILTLFELFMDIVS